MKIARVNIQFTRPFLTHALNPDALSDKPKEKRGSAGNDPEEWKDTMRVKPDGQVYLTGDMIFSCIRGGAKHVRSGRGNLKNKVAATLQVVEDEILLDRFLVSDPPINDKTAAVYVDVRGVRNPSTKGANIRYRLATSPGAIASFSVRFDPTIVSPNEVHQAIIRAGDLEGLGDARAIGFGRFEVMSFETA
jgi:hypothetical protein